MRAHAPRLVHVSRTGVAASKLAQPRLRAATGANTSLIPVAARSFIAEFE